MSQLDEQAADPADAFGVESVGGLVEQDGVRIAEQDTGQAEPLEHPERVTADPLPCRIFEADDIEHLVDTAGGDSVAGGQPAAGGGVQSVAGGRSRRRQSAHLVHGRRNDT